MNIRALMKNVPSMVSVALLCLSLLTSCKGWIYEDEGDCTVHYYLRFRYERNLKWADAFANEVTSVHLYAFDRSGVLVWQREETLSQETAADYSMPLELPSGDYRLLAWCGLKDENGQAGSFSVPEARVGETRMEQLECSLNRSHDESGAYSDTRLHRLFHGTLDVSLPSDEDGGSYDYTMYLTKDTNHIRVILQHLSGEDVDVEQFTFRIEDENGLLAHDNGVLEDETISYRPWKTQSGVAGIGRGEGLTIVDTKSAIADLTVGRMMEDHRKRMVLAIDRRDGGKVARIPVIDYALLAKEYYEEEYGHRMSGQEFLDREDEYVMTFFLDENDSWISSQILILSWHIVLNDVELD